MTSLQLYKGGKKSDPKKEEGASCQDILGGKTSVVKREEKRSFVNH